MKKFYTEDVTTEKKYRELSRLGKVLGVPIPECFLEMEIVLPNGKVLHRHKQRSHSWNRNAYNMVACVMLCLDADDAVYGAGNLNFKNTSNTIRSGAAPMINGQGKSGGNLASSETICYMAPSATHSYGIQVGTGNSDEDFEGCSLETLIANGTGAGQMSYGEMQPHVMAYDAGTLTLSCTLRRYINNNSSGSIFVGEVALTSRTVDLTYNSLSNVMLCRDKLNPVLEIPGAGQLKVTYTIALVHPA